MDGFLDVSKALWKGLYSRRDCIRQHINFPAVLKTKDVRFTQWPYVAFSRIGEGIHRWPFIKSFSSKKSRSTDKPDKRCLCLCTQFLHGSARSLAYSFIVSLFVKKVFRISVLDPFL